MDYYTSSVTNPSSSQFSSSKPNKNNKKGAKKCKGVRLSTDPQSVAARERRHRISDRFKILQSMVPGGTKMDTVSMLEEAIQYVKYLKTQIWLHQTIINFMDDTTTTTTTKTTTINNNINIINESSSSLPSPMYPSDYCCYLPSEQFMISPQQNATFDHNNNMQNLPQYCSFQQGELDTTYFDGSLKY